MAEPEEFDVRGEAGRPIILPITQGPATGHVWVLELPAGVRRLGDGPERLVPEGRQLGGSLGASLQVEADPGTYRLAARLARPWEPDSPVRVVNITLLVS